LYYKSKIHKWGLGIGLAFERADASFFSPTFQSAFTMKTSLLSLVTAFVLFASTAASAATTDHDRGPRRPSPREQARIEAMQRERAYRLAQQRAAERARFETMHRHDHDRGRDYSYNRH
jgi:hypothetical protein